MKNVFIINKKSGETPLAALEVFRKKKKKGKIKMTYAGRLDPMASGLLLILAGEETKNKQKYLSLEKEYNFEVLFGFATDTHDILGKVRENKSYKKEKKVLQKLIKDNLKYFTGKFIQKYPLFSSKTVKGKQLFEYGKENLDIELPEKEVFVKNLDLLTIKTINSAQLLLNIERRIEKIKGDFRQEEILKIWRKKLSAKNPKTFYIGSFKIRCGGGTYVRAIADSLGERIKVPALAFSIKRTQIGKWSKQS